jgi:hypothetical protein
VYVHAEKGSASPYVLEYDFKRKSIKPVYSYPKQPFDYQDVKRGNKISFNGWILWKTLIL